VTLQGKPVCLVLHKQASGKTPLSSAIIDHVLDLDSLHAALPELLTVVKFNVSEAIIGLQLLLQWIKCNSLR